MRTIVWTGEIESDAVLGAARFTPTQWLIEFERCQSVSHHAAEGLIRAQFRRISPLIRDFGNDSIDSQNLRSLF